MRRPNKHYNKVWLLEESCKNNGNEIPSNEIIKFARSSACYSSLTYLFKLRSVYCNII